VRFVEPITTGADRQSFAILMWLREEKLRWIGTFMTFEAAREAWERGIGT
jgi:hypothetical protein